MSSKKESGMSADQRGALHLRLCAFCGCEAKLAPMPNSPTWWRVRCNNYHCGGTTWAMGSQEEAIDAWNRRPHGEV